MLPKRTLVPLTLYLIVSIACTQLPLLNYLGYEFSAVIALLASFIAGFTTIIDMRALLQRTDSNEALQHSSVRSPSDITPTLHALRKNLLLLILPLGAMLVNAFFVKNCSLLEGVAFFLLIPVVSVAFSWALGFFCAVHYLWSKTIFTLFFLGTIGYTLALGYFTPSIFSYNFFYGYFPGLTYDEALGVPSSLVIFRILTLIIAAALVWMSWLIVKHSNITDRAWRKGFSLAAAMVEGKNVFITAALATLLIITWWFRGELGFESTSSFIRKQLGERVESEHFIIFYSKDSYDNDEIRWIAADHEFRLKQICDAFALPRSERDSSKIESYVYPSSDVKQRLMGAGNTNIAKPWSGQMHISKQSLDATLKHELVHVVAARFGLPIINASLSTGLVEGLAEAMDWNFGNRTLHQYAAAMHKAGVAPNIRSLMLFTGFAAQSSSISYVLAGSFSRFLIDTYGIRKMTLLYRTNDYETLYNKSLDDLIAEWKTLLANMPVTASDLAAVDVLFRRPPIFKKVCARVVAARNAKARQLLAEKNYSEAQTLFAVSYDETKGYESLAGLLTSSLRLGQHEAVTTAYDTIVASDKRPNQFLPLFLNIGDAFWARGVLDSAHRLYARLAAANISEGYTEAVLLRTHAFRDTIHRQAFARYFVSDLNDSLRLKFLGSAFARQTNWLHNYMKAKVLQRIGRYSDAVDMLRSFQLGSTDSTLEALRVKMLGYSLFRLKRFEDAKAAFWQSLNFMATDVAKNDVNEWVERCEWMKASANHSP
jgi:tetratricopeptide (TPR) repeat protein